MIDPERDWDAFVAANPRATYLQVSAWARVKAPNGWIARRIEAGSADRRVGARVLIRRPRWIPWAFGYAPRGPIAATWDDEALGAFTESVRSTLGRPGSGGDRLARLRIDPEIELDGPLDRSGSTRAALVRLGWRPGPEVQPAVTRVIDLAPAEATLWSDLRKKWRQYVNKARSGGVTVVERGAEGLSDFHRIMAETSRRAGMPIRTEGAYRDVWEAFAPSGDARLLMALGPAGEPQAALFLIRSGGRVVEPYGGMTAAGAESRANYLVKWEALSSSRRAGATSYDLWGLVTPGIRRFKEGFGGREVRLIGAWDLDLDRLGALAYRLAESRRRPHREPGPPAMVAGATAAASEGSAADGGSSDDEAAG